jgi:hypothetical protein
MIPRDILTNLKSELSRELAEGASVEQCAFSLGFWTAEGRQIAVIVEETNVPSVIRVSDGGESWSDLIMAGYTDSKPTRPELAALERLCELHRLRWDAHRAEMFCVVSASDFTDAARRVTSAALAIDGWRAWYPDLVKDPNIRASIIVKQLVQIAPRASWAVEANPTIRGRLHAWTPGARLARTGRNAAVSFFHEQEPEKVLERALAQIYDLPMPIICVVPERIAKALIDASELSGRAIAVPRLAHGTAELVIKAAEEIAA